MPRLEAGDLITPLPLSVHEAEEKGLTISYRAGFNAACAQAVDCAGQMADAASARIAEYEAVLREKEALVVELDIALNGREAARKAALVDLVVAAKSKSHIPQKALENIRMFVMRNKPNMRKDMVDTLMRFCRDGGSVPNPLRTNTTKGE